MTNEAFLASLAQTVGDVMAAIVMQVIPLYFSGDYDPDTLGCFRRTLHYIISPPYSLCVALGTWTMWNLGMMSPVLPVAITAQILMGTSYVSCFALSIFSAGLHDSAPFQTTVSLQTIHLRKLQHVHCYLPIVVHITIDVSCLGPGQMVVADNTNAKGRCIGMTAVLSLACMYHDCKSFWLCQVFSYPYSYVVKQLTITVMCIAKVFL